MERIPLKTNPKLFDEAVATLQRALANDLTWLDHSIGICEILEDIKEGKRFRSANLYKGNEQYEQIMPCEELGNFSFFVLKDPQAISSKNPNVIKTPFSLIVWYNMNKVSLVEDEHDREAIKGQILNVLSSRHFPWLEISKIYERPSNVFSDFTYEHTNNQFLMSPYAGLRIDGTLTCVNSKCDRPCGKTYYFITSDGKYFKTKLNEYFCVKH